MSAITDVDLGVTTERFYWFHWFHWFREPVALSVPLVPPLIRGTSNREPIDRSRDDGTTTEHQKRISGCVLSPTSSCQSPSTLGVRHAVLDNSMTTTHAYHHPCSVNKL